MGDETGGTEYRVDYTSMSLASDQLDDDIAILSSASSYIDTNLSEMDPRIANYLDGLYNISGMASGFSDLSTRTSTYQGWMNDTVDRVKALDSSLSEVPAQTQTKITLEEGKNNQGSHTGEEDGTIDTTIDPITGQQGQHQGEDDPLNLGQLGEMSEAEQNALKKALEEMGFSPEEIAQILNGERSLTPEEVAQLKAYLEKLAATNPELAKQLAEKLGLDVDFGDSSPEDFEKQETRIDPDEFEKLPQDVQDDIRKMLEEMGYSPEEIEKILSGEKELTPEDMEKIKAYIDKIRDENAELADQLDLAFGIPNAWAELPEEIKDQIKSMLEQMGYTPEEISDIVHGKKELTPEELDAIKAYIDSIRDQDPELADKLDLVFGIPNLWAELSQMDQNQLKRFLAELGYSQDDISAIVHGKKQLTPEELEKLKQWLAELEKTNPELAAKLRKLFGLTGDGVGSGVGGVGTAGVIDTQVGDITNEGTSIGGEVLAMEDSLAHTNGLEEGTSSLSRVAKSSIKKMASKISPYVGKTGEVDDKDNNNAAMVAAGILGGGAAAGGGVVIGKKLSVIRFTPEDWEALGADYQSVIQRVMKRSGLTDEEIEIFKVSKFQILASEINEHVKRIEKAYENNPQVEEDLVNLYNFSMFDEVHKVVKYLLFITMIIDGRNLIDQYNMYNVINQSFDDVDDADFTYSGINMDDYFYDMDEEKLEPSLPKLEKLGDDKVPETAKDKEWLQGIGINE